MKASKIGLKSVFSNRNLVFAKKPVLTSLFVCHAEHVWECLIYTGMRTTGHSDGNRRALTMLAW